MKSVCYVVRIFLTYALLFVLMKPVFMAYNHALGTFTAGDVGRVMLHGLPLDLSTAGYLTALPLLLALLSSWMRLPGLTKVLRTYFALTTFVLSIVLCTDCALYAFWQFKLDATIFNYLDSPREALASVSPWFVLAGVALILLLAALAYAALRLRSATALRPRPRRPFVQTLLLLLTGGVLFLFVRGGVGKSTMNIGRVYYSEQQFLNHAAVNPAFSLLYSSLKSQHFDRMFRFYDAATCSARFAQLGYTPDHRGADTLRLSTTRPNVVVILMEGFGATFIESLGGAAGVTPQFDRIAREGLLFTQCYANSFRTDRGTVSALSGYPAFPHFSVMKMPEKTRSLPSIARSLAAEGYTTHFLYGGDINFTNMKSYLLATGYQDVKGEEHFPLSLRKTHAWGVTDRITFDTLYNQIVHADAASPFFTTFLTLASHEPWKVPYDRIAGNEKENGMAYLDDCLGTFVDRLRQSPAWNRLLLVCVADHGIGYPEGLGENDKRRYHIPLLFVGGALRQPQQVDLICNQSDLPATLLGMLGVRHDDFLFSRDVLSPAYTYANATHTFDNGFAFIDSTGYTVVDFDSHRILTDLPTPSADREAAGKAFLQTAVDDFAKR